jgi:hypothetical protein
MFPNISIFVCLYHVYTEKTGEYTLMISSKGTEDLVA